MLLIITLFHFYYLEAFKINFDMLGFPTACTESSTTGNLYHAVDPKRGCCLNGGKMIGGGEAGKGAAETYG